MRFLAYSTASVLGSTTRESMLPTDLSQLSVKIVNGANSYYASLVATTIQSDATNDLLTATFSNSGVIIAAGQVLAIQVTGISNAPTTEALTAF